MDLEIVIIVAFLGLAAATEIYFDVLCRGLGTRVLRRLTGGQFPGENPGFWQRLAAAMTGWAAIIGLILLICVVVLIA